MYGLLLQMLAKGNGYKAGQLIGQLGDCHIYNNHMDQVKLQLSRDFKTLPTLDLSFGLKIQEGANNFIFIPSHNMFKLNNYEPHPGIKAPLAI